MRSISGITIQENTTVRKILEAIDKGKLGIVLVVSKNRKLSGIITDVDVRKSLLRGAGLHSPAGSIMNKRPIKVSEGTPAEEILSLMKKYNVRQLPVVNRLNEPVGLELLNDYFGKPQYDNTVVIMAGGSGKRLYPLTKDTPKPMLTVGDKPILENTIEMFKRHGFSDFVISVTNRQKKIKEFFKNGEKWGVKIAYLTEKRQLGTAGALSLLDRKSIKKPFFVANSDLLTSINLEHMLEYHLKHRSVATVGIKDYTVDIPYGIVKLKASRLDSFEEKPSTQYYINAGIYVFNPQVLRCLKKNTAIDMVSFIELLKKRGFTIACFPIHEYWLDIGQFDNYRKANKDYRRVLKRS